MRDGIVPDMEASGQVVMSRRLSEGEYAAALNRKSVEEAEEFNPHEAGAANELADQLTVLLAKCELIGIDLEDLRQLEAAITVQRGSFSSRTHVETVTLADEDAWVAYYEADPDKYPEIKE